MGNSTAFRCCTSAPRSGTRRRRARRPRRPRARGTQPWASGIACTACRAWMGDGSRALDGTSGRRRLALPPSVGRAALRRPSRSYGTYVMEGSPAADASPTPEAKAAKTVTKEQLLAMLTQEKFKKRFLKQKCSECGGECSEPRRLLQSYCSRVPSARSCVEHAGLVLIRACAALLPEQWRA